jgi:hypothetical protein
MAGDRSFDPGPSGRGHDLTGAKSRLAAARRREGSLLRRMGQRAMEALAQKGKLDSQDPEARIILEDLLRVHQEVNLLEDRVRCLQIPRAPYDQPLSPRPGTDAHFPFSR